MQFVDLKRREFITLLGGAAAWPFAARAQRAMPVVGFLSSRSPGESAEAVAAFRRGLRQIGFVEGQNVVIAFRWAEGHYDRLTSLANDLVESRVAAIFAAGGLPSALAAKAASSTIPIIFLASEPVRQGLVSNLSRPEGNVTGIANLVPDLASKSVETLKMMLPSVATIAYLVNPSNPVSLAGSVEALRAADALGIRATVLNASTTRDIDDAFTQLSKLGIRALVVMGEPFFDSQRENLVELSNRHSIAGCYPWREYVLAGGLMSYGSNLIDSYRQAGIYAGRVLRGEKPSELPVMLPTKFELVINLQTAKRLGIEVPPALLVIADEVIE
jgi:ABC-type uncharacterized transport system substrate-binding protein